MEYVDTDLAKLINTGQKLSAEHVKCIMLQVPLHTSTVMAQTGRVFLLHTVQTPRNMIR